ncbi:mitochondrial fission ELM1 family protein [Commensalibacter oyaizuii]|uniref:Mitochondrial fission ELM1 family protein n=1 Tax=Commensalibacter oyaizuii TaxID=3043873 RepID=A0ABT6PZQ2_9PROT|nr:mitochondrial fission ELM1 family protein [Commensalibacter sp. TBRC 16381]MDI2090331.1 mitochondrial fission ELM1 family protein [Commensalibacter sp. TBRC 16381]
MSRAVILTENFAGMKSQAIGFAQRAGFQTELCHLTPKLPWSLISAPYWPFPLSSVQSFEVADSSILISVGSVGGVINAALRKKGRPSIHIQNPRISACKFDLVVVNPHDNLTGENVLVSRTALHHITSELLLKNKNLWSGHFKTDEQYLVTVLIGGNNGRFILGEKEAHHIADQLTELIKVEKIQVALTPSRRTNPQVIKIFQDRLVPLGAYIWDGKGDNPYLGLLACADTILVTTDSVSMISEAVATPVPVMVLPLPGKSKRILSFIQSMQEQNRIKIFDGHLEEWAVKPLDDTEEIVFKAKRYLHLL